MRVLVVGLGSMGKRRIRCLKALGVTEIAGVDGREDRRSEASFRYGIGTFWTLEKAAFDWKPDVMIISTPPDHHFLPAALAVEKRIPCFIEASVDIEGVQKLIEHCDGSLIAPSCTMRYFPNPKMIKASIAQIGKPLNINYHVGQYLPDWHPYEDIRDFYVGKRETGACREIVPFELTWLNDIFGDPEPLSCVKTKLTDLPVDIDDIYHCVLRYPSNVLCNLTIDVISRPATREFRLLGSEGQVSFSGLSDYLGFNYEQPYIDELRDFLIAVEQSTPFQNTLRDDYRVLRALNRLEALSV